MKKGTVKYMQRATTTATLCSVPLCNASVRYCSLSFHRFPADEDLRKKWLVKIRRDNFTVTSSSSVCGRHFLTEDMVKTLGGRRCLRKGAVPVLFEWNGYQVRQRVSVWKRIQRREASCTDRQALWKRLRRPEASCTDQQTGHDRGAGAEDQCVSSLQVKMSSPAPTSTVSVKQKPEDHMDIKTWLSQQITASAVNLPGVTMQRAERTERLRGGRDFIPKTCRLKPTDWKLPVKKQKQTDCDKCGKNCVTGHRLKLHQRTHTGEKPYQCDQCGKTMSSSSELKCHLMIHTGEKPYQCDQCGKRFRRRSGLKTHKKSHSGEKPYQCDQCGKSFSIHGNLKTHLRIHTGEKPYICNLCGEKFSSSSTLKSHQRNHTRDKL